MIAEVTTWFAVGAAGMVVGTLLFVVGGLNAASGGRKYYAMLTAISGIAAVAYALMALEVGWHPVDERTVFVPRYVDWLLTTPLLLLYLAVLIDCDRSTTLKLLGINTIVIVTGFGAALVPGTERFVLFGIGSVVFVGVLYYLMGPLTRQARGQTIESVFLSLRNLTVVLWSVYPLIWVTGPPGLDLLTVLADVLLVTYLDLVTKVGFGIIAINASTVLNSELSGTGEADVAVSD